MPAQISLTEIQALSALETFISDVVSSAVFEASISNEVMTVTQVFAGELTTGQLIVDPGNMVQPNTRISSAPNYLNGGVGVYSITIPQTTSQLIMMGVVEIVRGQDNRVPEPLGGDFVVMTPTLRKRLSFNNTEWADGAFSVTINGNVMTVLGMIKSAPTLLPGVPIADISGELMANTIIGQQLSGVLGGEGTYFVSPAQFIKTPITAYAGLRYETTPTQLTIQVDIHGPLSGDNAQIIAGLLRSEYATQIFAETGYEVVPLYTSDPHQAPFLNAEQQIEYRWTIDCELQVNPIVSIPQQFFDNVQVTLIEVDSE